MSDEFRKLKFKSKEAVVKGGRKVFVDFKETNAEKKKLLVCLIFWGPACKENTYHSRCDARAASRQDPEACEHGSGSDIISSVHRDLEWGRELQIRTRERCEIFVESTQ